MEDKQLSNCITEERKQRLSSIDTGGSRELPPVFVRGFMGLFLVLL